MKSLNETIEGLTCCSNGRDCEVCPYQGVNYCEDAVRDDAAQLLRDYEERLALEARGK